ncbi:hypothetical protein [Oceanobacillus halophilus]|uniref:Uncharacterized protein n=1 Tax=Oceanobacillus halophilus TaxID=930130 RepID=A0A494ZV26_9BACI|nr:hypothetical protein [Oceanobacillus halophilus]RKQ30261.1 hypothetical protein D8M06_16350 [Oceanobacillus halophilus]
MKEKNESIKKVLEFSQSKTNRKQFRHDYPIPKEIRDEMMTEIYADFTKYVTLCHYDQLHPQLHEFSEEHQTKPDKRGALEYNLFWSIINYLADENSESSCVEDYIAENYLHLKTKPLITSWLREWDKAIPKFYYVGYKYNDRSFVVVDMLENKTLDVIVYNQDAVPPKKGEIVMGILIPEGDALYFPIIDFYHFDFTAREEIGRHILYYFEKYLKDFTLREAFFHVLSAALQVEQYFSKEHTSSQ